MLSLTSLVSVLAVSAVSVSAIQVTYPSKSDTWTTSGAQKVEWDSVNTDATSFAMVLVNQDSSFLADTTSLSDNVTTSLGSLSVTMPSGDFPVGTAFQVNFIKKANQQSTILAQSEMFNITQSPETTTATTATTAATTTTGTTTTAAGTSAVTSASSAASSVAAAAASASSAATSTTVDAGTVSSNIPGNTSGASSSYTTSASLLLAVAGVVGAALL